jgi:hypothetical protein
MKGVNSMKRNSIGTSLFLLLTGLFALAIYAFAPLQLAQAQFGPQRGNNCCDQIAGKGQDVLVGDAFVVNAEFNLSGPRFSGAFGAQGLQIKSTTRLLTQNPPTADGTINGIRSHVFEVKGQSDEDGQCEPGEDCLVTLDRAALIPTATPGLMKLRSALAISSGQGRFEKACGKIDGTDSDNEINFGAQPPTVRWSFSGDRICECR